MAEDPWEHHQLHQAIERDSVDYLHTLIVEEPGLLDRLSEHPFPHTPLHIAAAKGKTDVAMELAILKPSFARKLNADGYSPMHLALQNKHYDTVRALMTIDPNLIRVRGRHGITPLHYVVEKYGADELELLAEFLCTRGSSIEDLTSRRETAVHVAVKKHNLEALKVLLGWLELVHLKNVLHWKDKDGGTALSIARQSESPQQPPPPPQQQPPPPLQQPPLQPPQQPPPPPPLQQQPPPPPQPQQPSSPPQQPPPPPPQPPPSPQQQQQEQEQEQLQSQIIKLLERKTGTPPTDDRSLSQLLSTGPTFIEDSSNLYGPQDESARNIIIGVATLVATTTYQAALTPPGGYWQDDSSNSTVVTANSSGTAFKKPHHAGNIILTGSDLHLFTVINSMVFVMSILTIWITSIPLWPRTFPVYLLMSFLGLAYFITATIGYPKSDSFGFYFIWLSLLSLMVGMMNAMFMAGRGKYACFRYKVEATARRMGNFPGWKDGK